VDQLRPVHERRLQRRAVEIEPADACRRCSLGIDRDDLEVGPRETRGGDSEQAVVRAHQRMPATRARRDPQRRLAPRDALGQRARRDDEVIEREAALTARARRERSSTLRPPTHSVSPSDRCDTRPAALQPCPARRRSCGGATPAPISHCARLALRLPVTGSSGTPRRGEGAHLELAVGAGRMRPDDADLGQALQRRVVGLERQHRRRVDQHSASQRGPLSSHCAHARSSAPGRAPAAAAPAVAAVDRCAARRRGEGQRAPSRRIGTRPDAALLHDSAPRGSRRRASSQAWQLPSVGWPANGSSPPGVKMRTR
jgi:hypothetical protein